MSPFHIPAADDLEGWRDKAIEEMAEMTKALLKHKHYGDKATDPLTGVMYDNLQDVTDEMDDVLQSMVNLARLLGIAHFKVMLDI